MYLYVLKQKTFQLVYDALHLPGCSVKFLRQPLKGNTIDQPPLEDSSVTLRMDMLVYGRNYSGVGVFGQLHFLVLILPVP